MRRNSHSLLAAVSAALAAVLLIAGGLLLWGSAYVHNTVQGQLAAQQIYLPARGRVRARQGGHRDHPEHDPVGVAVRRAAAADRAAGRGLRRPLHRPAHHRHVRRQDLLPAVRRVDRAAEQHPADRPGRHRVQGRDAAVHAAERLRLVEGLPDHLHRRAGSASASAPWPAFVAGFAFVTGRRTETAAEVLTEHRPDARVKVA